MSLSCLLLGLCCGALAVWLLNPFSARAWCSNDNGCAFWPANQWVAVMAFYCYGVSAALMVASVAALRARGWVAAIAVIPGLAGASVIAFHYAAFAGWR